MSITVDGKTDSASAQGDYFTFARATGSIDALDGLRTIAIALVLLRHAIAPLYEEIGSAFQVGSWNFAIPMLNGWMGVDLFFILSGFLIGSHLIKRRDHFTRQSLGAYFGSRALRIVPTYFFVLFVVAAGTVPLFTPAAENVGASILWHLLFLQDYLGSNFIVAFWSLGVEEKFYILAPFLVIGIGKLKSIRQRLVLLTILTLTPMSLRAITLSITNFEYSYLDYFRTFRSPFHMTFEGLIIGVICAELRACQGARNRLTLITRPLAVLGTAIVLIHLLPFDLMAHIGLYDILFQPLLLSVGFGMILMACVLGNPKDGWLSSTFSLIGARLSYSLYLIHMAVIPMALVPAYVSGTTGIAFFAIFLCAYLALAIAASWLIHFAVEKPFLMLKSRLF